MKRPLMLMAIFIGAVFVMLVAGCKGDTPSTRVFVRKGDQDRIRVAVIPFDNVSRSQDAGRILTNTVVTFLLSTGEFDVVDPGVVNGALTTEGIRTSGDGLTQEAMQKLQGRLNVDTFVIGLVEDYGEVRVGAETYPSISFSARLVEAKTTNILWAATISKTGDENVKVFDIGRESSLGKLCKKAVNAMALSMLNSKQNILQGITPKVKPADTTPANDNTNTTTNTTTNTMTNTNTNTTSTQNLPPTGASAKYLDETLTYGQKELTALLKDINDMKLGEVSYQKHYHDTVEVHYQLADGKKYIEVKLVDYLKATTAQKFIDHYNPEKKATTFETLPAYAGDAEFNYYHLDLAVGRFGVFLRGAKANQTDMETLAKGLIALLK